MDFKDIKPVIHQCQYCELWDENEECAFFFCLHGKTVSCPCFKRKPIILTDESRLLTKQEMLKINNAQPAEAKYGDVFEAIAKAQLAKDMEWEAKTAAILTDEMLKSEAFAEAASQWARDNFWTEPP